MIHDPAVGIAAAAINIKRRSEEDVTIRKQLCKTLDLIGMVHLPPVPLHLLKSDHVRLSNNAGYSVQIDQAIAAFSPLNIIGCNKHRQSSPGPFAIVRVCVIITS